MLVDISNSLKQVLKDNLPKDNLKIRIGSVTEEGAASENELLLFLYAAGENPFTKNRSLVRDGEGHYRPPAMHLTLHYMIAYLSDDQEQVQRRLEGVLQAFHSLPRIGPEKLKPSLLEQISYLGIRLLKPGMDELNQLWTALNQPMRLALYYEVNAALISAKGLAPVPAVTGREFRGPMT